MTKNFRQTALLAAEHACNAIVKYFGKTNSFEEKKNKSLVGIADIGANKAIIQIINENFPDHSILSEETGFEDKKSPYRWIIDPLDGTHNFLHKIPIFGTSIALEHNGELILGVLQFPLLCITAVAEKGKGAYINGKKARVSTKETLEHSFVLFEFSYANRKEKTKFLENFIHEPIDVRNFGSAIYNLMLIACGKCESYVIMSTNEWDVAAGFLIVEEAGGRISDFKGRKWSLDQKKFVISNGKVHDKILKFLR